MLVPLGPVFSDAGARRRHGRASASSSSRSGSAWPSAWCCCRCSSGTSPRRRSSPARCSCAGVSLIVAASMSALGSRRCSSAILGVCAGSVYVLGFTLLHENVDDELRGRIFSALYTLVRFCVLLAFAVGPFLSDAARPPQRASSFDGDDLGRRRRRSRCPACGSRCGSPASSSWAPACSPRVAPRRRAGRRRRRGPPSALDELLLQEGAELVSGITGPFTEVRRSHERTSRDRRSGAGARPADGRPTRDRALHRVRGRRGERQVHPGPAPRRPPRRAGAAHLRAGRLAARRRGASPRARLARPRHHRPGRGAADGRRPGPARRRGDRARARRRAHRDLPTASPARRSPTRATAASSRPPRSSSCRAGPPTGCWPDLVVLLEVPPEAAERRLRRARTGSSRPARPSTARVHDGFLLQAMADPDRWAIIDGTGTEDEVADGHLGDRAASASPTST